MKPPARGCLEVGPRSGGCRHSLRCASAPKRPYGTASAGGSIRGNSGNASPHKWPGGSPPHPASASSTSPETPSCARIAAAAWGRTGAMRIERMRSDSASPYSTPSSRAACAGSFASFHGADSYTNWLQRTASFQAASKARPGWNSSIRAEYSATACAAISGKSPHPSPADNSPAR